MAESAVPAHAAAGERTGSRRGRTRTWTWIADKARGRPSAVSGAAAWVQRTGRGGVPTGSTIRTRLIRHRSRSPAPPAPMTGSACGRGPREAGR